MKVAKRKRRKATGRTRCVPHTIYLSEDESANFRAKAAAKGRTLSDQVRFWVNQESRRRKPAAAVSGEHDPRQTSIEDLAPRPEGEALREWAEREGRTDLLEENVS